jgi:hypothetical protein
VHWFGKPLFGTSATVRNVFAFARFATISRGSCPHEPTPRCNDRPTTAFPTLGCGQFFPHLLAETRYHNRSAPAFFGQFQQTVPLCILQQFRERVVAVIRFVEARFEPFHRILDERRPEHFLIFAA